MRRYLCLLALVGLVACGGDTPATVVGAIVEPSPTPTVTPTAGAGSAPPAPRASGSGPTPTMPRAAVATTSRGTTTRAETPLAGTPLPALAAGQTYRDPQNRFSFTIPGNWIQVQPAGAEVAFQSPVPPGAVPATVNVVLEKLPSASVTLDEYDQAGEANLRQQFADYTPIGVTRVTVDGRPAYKRVYTATIAGRQLQLQQVYLLDRDVAYVVTCGATQETFGSNVAVFEQIAGSFKLGAP